jgi:hypothetical protein
MAMSNDGDGSENCACGLLKETSLEIHIRT